MTRHFRLLCLASFVFLTLITNRAQVAPNNLWPTNQATAQLAPVQLRWEFGPARNYILNPGFEAGFAGWSLRGTGTLFTSTNSTIFSGRASAIVSAGVAGFSTLSQIVRLPAGPDRLLLRWKAFLRTENLTGVGSANLFVTIYDTNGVTLGRVFSLSRSDNRVTRWVPFVADLTAFRGQTIALAFEYDAGGSTLSSAGIDDVELVGRSDKDGNFILLFGTSAALTDANRRAETPLPFATVDGLNDSTRYYWQVLLKQGDITVSGPVQSFTTGAGSSQPRRSALTAPLSPAVAAVPTPFTLVPLDGAGRPSSTAIQAQISAWAIGDRARAASLLIAEVDPATPNGVELMNVSDQPIALKGWGLEFLSSSGATARFTFPTNATAQPGEPFIVRAATPASAYPTFGSTLSTFGFTALNGANVFLVDPQTNTVDMFIAGRFTRDTFPPQQFGIPRALRPGDWLFPPVPPFLQSGETWQRVGQSDRNNMADWVVGSSTMLQRNPRMANRFEAGPGLVSIAPSVFNVLTRSFTTNVVFSQPFSGLFFTETQFGSVGSFSYSQASSPIDVYDRPAIRLTTLSRVDEGSGPVNAVRADLSSASTADVVVRLDFADSSRLKLRSQTATIQAGQTSTTFSVEALENAVIDGSAEIAVTGTADGFVVLPTTIMVDDNDSATLTFSAPASLPEGGTGDVALSVNPAPSTDVSVSIQSSDPDSLAVPRVIKIPSGVAQVHFSAAAPDNVFADGNRSVNLTATVPGWITATATIGVQDDDQSRLILVGPATLVEGNGGPGTVGLLLPAPAAADLTVQIQSSDPSQLTAPATVVIPAGGSGTTFTVAAVDDPIQDGPRDISLTVSAVGFQSQTVAVRVLDNEPARIEFATFESPQYVGASLALQIKAFDSSGAALVGVSSPITLSLSNATGITAISGTSILFTNGVWTGSVSIPSASDYATLTGVNVTGSSKPFRVLESSVTRIPLMAYDIAIDTTRTQIVASVSQFDPGHSNTVVWIDPASGAILDSRPVTFGDPPPTIYREGRLLTVGSSLYVAHSGAARVARFSLTDKTQLFDQIVNTTAAPGYVSDMIAAPGYPGTIILGRDPELAALTSAGQVIPTSGRAGTIVVPGPDLGKLYAIFENGPYPWTLVTVTGGASIDNQYLGFIRQVGGDVKLFNREIITGKGEVLGYDQLDFKPSFVLGAGDHQVIAQTNLGRVLFLGSEAAAGSYMLQAFDYPSRALLRSLPVSVDSGFRRLIAAQNFVAFNTANNVYLIQSRLFSPAASNVQISLSQALSPAQPNVGSDFHLFLTLTNSSSQYAGDAFVNFRLPDGVQAIDGTPSSGEWSQSAGVVRWRILQFPAAVSQTLDLRLRSRDAGILTNSFAYGADEWNEANPNGLTNFNIIVQASLSPDQATSILPGANDAVWDSTRNLFYLARQDGKLAAIRASNGLGEFELDLGGPIVALGLDPNNAFVYALTGQAAVRKIDLNSRTAGAPVSLETTAPVYDVEVLPSLNDGFAVSGRGFIQIWESGTNKAQLSYSEPYQSLALDPETSTVFTAAQLSPSLPIVRFQRFNALNGNFNYGSFGQFSMQYLFGALHSAGGRIYLPSGNIIDPGKGWPSGAFATGGTNSAVAVDSSARRAFFLTKTNDGALLESFDTRTFGRLDSRPLAYLPSRPLKMMTWGPDGLAAVLESGQFEILRTTLRPTQIATDLRVSVSPVNAELEKPFMLSFTVENVGEASAADTIASIGFSDDIVFEALTAGSALPFKSNGNSISISLQTLNPHESKSVSVRLRPLVGGNLNIPISVVSDAVQSPLDDNFALSLVRVSLPERYDAPLTMLSNIIDVVSDSSGANVFATVEPDRVVRIDPASGGQNDLYSGLLHPGALAISSDNAVLYVESPAEARFSEIDSATGALIKSFPYERQLNERVTKMIVAPNRRERVFAAFQGSNREAGVVYENGAPIGGDFSPRYSFAFISDSQMLLSSDPKIFPPLTFRGSSTVDGFVLGPEIKVGSLGDFVIDGDWIVGNTGGIFKLPDVAPAGKLAGSGAPAINAGARFASILQFNSAGGSGVIHYYSLETQGELSSLAVSNAGPKLLKWGTNGLAWVGKGRLQLLRSSRWPVGASSDIALSMDWLPPLNGRTQIRATVHNLGPSPAPQVQANFTVSTAGGVIFTNISSALGSVARTGATAQWILPGLDSGAQAAAVLEVVPGSSGLVVANGIASSQAPDPDYANNRADGVFADWSVPADSSRRFSLPMNYVAYDQKTKLLYASVRGSTSPAGLYVIDPSGLQPAHYIQTIAEPGYLTVSPDSKRLYVLVDNPFHLQRFRLPDLFLEQSTDFALTIPTTVITDLAVAPGDTPEFAIARGGRVEVYRDGSDVRMTDSASYSSQVEFGTDPSVLWTAYDFINDGVIRRMKISDGSIGIDSELDSLTHGIGHDFRIRDRRLFFGNGQVADADSLTVITNLNYGGTMVTMEGFPPRLILGHLTGTSLQVFDPDSYAKLGSIPLSGFTANQRQMVRWGADGVAVVTDNELVLIRSSLLAPSVTADSDGDGMPDVWEIAHGLDPLTSDAREDADRDGLSNLGEYLAGSDPQDPHSNFTLELIGGHLRFPSLTGRSYQLEGTLVLEQPWQAVGAPLIGNGSALETSLPGIGDHGYFRVRISVAP